MSIKVKIVNIALLLAVAILCSARVVAYEIQGSPAFDSKLSNGGANDLFKNTQPEINKVIKGLYNSPSSESSSDKGVSIDGFFNFKNFSTNDVGSIIKSVFGLVFKVLAVIVTVTIDALRGILGSVQK